MFRWGRRKDTSFSQDEDLYWRFTEVGYNEHALTRLQWLVAILRAQFRLPDQSVNRSKYSRPFDVLFPDHCDLGVLSFRVSTIPSHFAPDSVRYGFTVEHVPLWCNYSHSEIWVYKNQTRMPHNQKLGARTVKHHFFKSVAASARVERHPTLGEALAWLKRRLGKW